MKYVALLRGINVGGNSKIEMKRLKLLFESLGFTNVLTYINSGNVIFESPEKPSSFLKKIEATIHEEFQLSVPVTVRNADQIKLLAESVPANWLNNTEMKTDVLFLWDEVNTPQIVDTLNLKPEIDTVIFTDGALIWNVDRKNINKSSLLKIVGTSFYKKVTIRNINTVRKLQKLLE